MALTEVQRDAAIETLRIVNEEVSGICQARDDVTAALRLDVVDDPNIEALNVIQNAKVRAKGHADALSAVLAP